MRCSVRTAPDGQRVADDLFPYLWGSTQYLLRPPAHDEALRVLDEFLETHGEKLVADPQKRLLLQRDLWAVFDWCAPGPEDAAAILRAILEGGDLPRPSPKAKETAALLRLLLKDRDLPRPTPKADEAAAAALRGRLAKAIGRLALSPSEIAALPDNYRAAVRAHAFPSEYDPARREQTYFPADLLDADGPWLCVEAESQTHANAVGGRSLFLTFVQVPGGKRATEDYLNALHSHSQFPAGTRMALLRQALAIDDAGQVVLTNVTESLQVRVCRRKDDWNDPFDVYQFDLDRRAWAGGGPGFHALGPDDRSLWVFQRDFLDPFETPAKGPGDELAGVLTNAPTPTLQNCGSCHNQFGLNSLRSLPSFSGATSSRDHGKVAPTLPAAARERAVRTKSKRDDWRMLHQLITTEAARRPSAIPDISHKTEAPANTPAAPLSASSPSTNPSVSAVMQTPNTEFVRAVYTHELLLTRLADAKKDEHVIQSSITDDHRVTRYSVEVKVTSFGKPFTATSESADGHVKETLTVTLTPMDDAKQMQAKFDHVVRQDGEVRLQFSGLTVLARLDRDFKSIH